MKPVEIDEATLGRLRPLIDAEQGEWDADAAVTHEQAVEDIECFFDILRLCYAGYDYYADKIDFAGLKEQIIRGLPDGPITAMMVKNAVYHTLKPHINDTHFYFLTGDASSFENLYYAYFTGVTVAEANGGYAVVSDETERFGVGHRFTAVSRGHFVGEPC